MNAIQHHNGKKLSIVEEKVLGEGRGRGRGKGDATVRGKEGRWEGEREESLSWSPVGMDLKLLNGAREVSNTRPIVSIYILVIQSGSAVKCLSLCLSVHPSAYLSVSHSVCLSFSLPVCLSASLHLVYFLFARILSVIPAMWRPERGPCWVTVVLRGALWVATLSGRSLSLCACCNPT